VNRRARGSDAISACAPSTQAGGDDGEYAHQRSVEVPPRGVSIWWTGEDFKLMEARAGTSAGDVSASHQLDQIREQQTNGALESKKVLSALEDVQKMLSTVSDGPQRRLSERVDWFSVHL
jgi:hypothetical protein